MADDLGEQESADGMVVNLASVAPFDATAEALAALPCIRVRVPQEVESVERVETEIDGEVRDEELVDQMVLALGRASRECGHVFGETAAVAAGVEIPSKHRRVLSRMRSEGAGKKRTPLGDPLDAAHVHEVSRSVPPLGRGGAVAERTACDAATVDESSLNKPQAAATAVSQDKSSIQSETAVIGDMRWTAAETNSDASDAERNFELYLAEVTGCRPDEPTTSGLARRLDSSQMMNVVRRLKVDRGALDTAKLCPDLVRGCRKKWMEYVTEAVSELKSSDDDDEHLERILLGTQASVAVLTLSNAAGITPQAPLSDGDLELVASLARTFVLTIVLPWKNSETLHIFKAECGPCSRRRIPSDVLESKFGASGVCTNRKRIRAVGPAIDPSELCSWNLEQFERWISAGNRLPESVVAALASTAVLPFKARSDTSVRMSAARLIKQVFRSRPKFREYLLTELRTCIEHNHDGRTNLRDQQLRDGGKRVAVMSALVVELAQSAVGSTVTSPEYSGRDLEETRRAGMKAGTDAAGFFVQALLRKLMAEDSGEQRTAVNNLLTDMFNMFGSPEYPGAELVVQSLCYGLIRTVKDFQNARDGHVNGMASKLQGIVRGSSEDAKEPGEAAHKLLSDLRSRVKAGLCSEDALNCWIAQYDGLGGSEMRSLATTTSWKPTPALRQEVVQSALRVTGSGFMVKQGTLLMLDAITAFSNDPSARLRAKALAALANFVDSHPERFCMDGRLREIVTGRCLDVSSLVRDAALEVTGRILTAIWSRHMEENPEKSIYPHVFGRLADTSVLVRKRAVAISRNILLRATAAGEAQQQRLLGDQSRPPGANSVALTAEICSRLASRLTDAEASVRDSASRALLQVLIGEKQSTGAPAPRLHASLAARRLVATFMRIERAPAKQFVASLFDAVRNADIPREHLMELISWTIEAMDAVSDVEPNGTPDGAEDSTRDLAPAASNLVAAIAVVEPELLVPHWRRLQSYCVASPSGRCEIAHVRNMLCALECCIPFLSKDSPMAELEDRLVSVVNNCRNELLAEKAIQCQHVLSLRSPRARNQCRETMQTLAHFLEASGENGEGEGPIKATLSSAVQRLGHYLRHTELDASEVEGHFKRLMVLCSGRTDHTWHSNTSGVDESLRQASLSAVCSLLKSHPILLPQAEHLLRDALAANGEFGEDRERALKLQVLADLQEMLLEEENRGLQAQESATGKARAHFGEDEESSSLVGTVQNLQTVITATTLNAHKRIRLRGLAVLALMARQGLVLPASVTPALIAAHADREDRTCVETAKGALSLLCKRHPQMVFSRVVPGILRSFESAMATDRSGQLRKDPCGLALDEGTNYALISPVLEMLPAATRRAALLAVLGVITKVGVLRQALEEPQISLDIEAQRWPLTCFLASTVASYNFHAGCRVGMRTQSAAAAEDVKRKFLRDEISSLLAAIAKTLATHGGELLGMVEGAEFLTASHKSEMAERSAYLCVLMKTMTLLRQRMALGSEADTRGASDSNTVRLHVDDMPFRPAPGLQRAGSVDEQLRVFCETITALELDEDEAYLSDKGPTEKRRSDQQKRMPTSAASTTGSTRM